MDAIFLVSFFILEQAFGLNVILYFLSLKGSLRCKILRARWTASEQSFVQTREFKFDPWNPCKKEMLGVIVCV